MFFDDSWLKSHRKKMSVPVNLAGWTNVYWLEFLFSFFLLKAKRKNKICDMHANFPVFTGYLWSLRDISQCLCLCLFLYLDQIRCKRWQKPPGTFIFAFILVRWWAQSKRWGWHLQLCRKIANKLNRTECVNLLIWAHSKLKWVKYACLRLPPARQIDLLMSVPHTWVVNLTCNVIIKWIS